MVKFSCKKLGRDKRLEGFKSQNIKPTYRFLNGNELQEALKYKLIEEVEEVCDSRDRQEMIAELAVYARHMELTFQEVQKIKAKKYNDRGGFEKGLYIETLEMDEANSRIEHFRKSPDKYPEL